MPEPLPGGQDPHSVVLPAAARALPPGFYAGANAPPDPIPVTVHERAVLRKYDGDDQSQPPVEVVLIEDGEITGHWAGKEVANAPTE